MAAGFTWAGEIVGAKSAPILTQGFVAGVTIVGGYLAVKALKKSEDPVIPEERVTIKGLFDLVATFIVLLGDNAMGKENRHYLPFAATIFLYILSMNLIGLVPGFSMPTDQFQLNFGIALLVFILYNYWGIREVGLGNYLKHLLGGSQFLTIFLLPIGLMLFCIELVGHVFRPITLSLRLFGNMTGDHLALAVFTEMTKFGIPVAFYLLGTIVCFMQAFVFTLLAMIYIRLAVAHEDH